VLGCVTVAELSHADNNSRIVINNEEQKRTNLCWSLIRSLFRISLPPGEWE